MKKFSTVILTDTSPGFKANRLYAVDALGNCRGAPRLDEGDQHKITVTHDGALKAVLTLEVSSTGLPQNLGKEPDYTHWFSFRYLQDGSASLKQLLVNYDTEDIFVDFLAQDSILWIDYLVEGKKYQCPIKLNLGEIAGL